MNIIISDCDPKELGKEIFDDFDCDDIGICVNAIFTEATDSSRRQYTQDILPHISKEVKAILKKELFEEEEEEEEEPYTIKRNTAFLRSEKINLDFTTLQDAINHIGKLNPSDCWYIINSKNKVIDWIDLQEPKTEVFYKFGDMFKHEYGIYRISSLGRFMAALVKVENYGGDDIGSVWDSIDRSVKDYSHITQEEFELIANGSSRHFTLIKEETIIE